MRGVHAPLPPVFRGVRSVDEEREVMARNTLFLAVTRPALFAGIPIEAAVVILLASVITMIGTTNTIYGGVVAAVMRSEAPASENQSQTSTSQSGVCWT